jgi:DNA-binding beta-propeller fold protein YncE
VLRIDPSGSLKRIAGQYNVMCCSYGDTQALAATLYSPNGLAVNTDGNVFVADARMNQVRVVTPSGYISTFAGRLHSEGDGGVATSALLNYPGDVRPDGRGGFYIADTLNEGSPPRGPSLHTRGTVLAQPQTGMGQPSTRRFTK